MTARKEFGRPWLKHQQMLKEMNIAPTDVDWARLAAFIDGEGCISIKYKGPSANKRKTVQHGLYVTIVNTDARLMRWIKETFSGSYYNTRFAYAKNNWKTALRWEVYGVAAAWVLENTAPFMIIKREQAEVALDLQNNINVFRRPGEQIPFEVFEYRDGLKEKLHGLKKVVHVLEESNA